MHKIALFIWFTTVCTVDLLTPRIFAHARTVQPVSAIYSAFLCTRSSIYPHMTKFPFFSTNDSYIYVETWGISTNSIDSNITDRLIGFLSP